MVGRHPSFLSEETLFLIWTEHSASQIVVFIGERFPLERLYARHFGANKSKPDVFEERNHQRLE